MEEQEKSVLFSLGIDHITQSHLLSIAKWNKFMAITGIVLGFLFLLAAIFGSTSLIYDLSRLGGNSYDAGLAPRTGYFAGVIIFYVILLAVFVIPCFFRLGFANKMIKALRSHDQELLNASLQKLKVYSIYWGVLTIVTIAFYALVIIVLVISAAIR